jgi:hypothetical protein
MPRLLTSRLVRMLGAWLSRLLASRHTPHERRTAVSGRWRLDRVAVAQLLWTPVNELRAELRVIDGAKLPGSARD